MFWFVCEVFLGRPSRTNIVTDNNRNMVGRGNCVTADAMVGKWFLKITEIPSHERTAQVKTAHLSQLATLTPDNSVHFEVGQRPGSHGHDVPGVCSTVKLMLRHPDFH